MFSIEYFSVAFFAIVGFAGILTSISFTVFNEMVGLSYDCYPAYRRSTVRTVTIVTSYLMLLWLPYAMFVIITFIPCVLFKKQLTNWMRRIAVQRRWGNV